jgi:hypothetical protein
MVHAVAEMVFASIPVNAAVTEVQLSPENVQGIQIVSNVAIIYLVKETMEEVELVYFQTNAVEILPVENVLEELISNVV